MIQITDIKSRIESIIEKLNADLYEREESIAVILLCALAGQNSFLLGPPGTAKSLISRRLACAFRGAKYFECLMNRFSTPEEVFGPISIKELKEDKYTRKIKGYLPDADFVFLDEIWKSSPAILNTLLTLVNEHIFRNGDESVRAPLKALVSASNETPEAGQGLDAMYDRFLVRLMVTPMSKREHFESLLHAGPTAPEVFVPENLSISTAEWVGWQKDILKVSLSPETLQIVASIRLKLEKLPKKQAIYVSDRRWQRAAMLMKTAAFFCGRDTTNLSDTLLLRHCLWTDENNRDAAIALIEASVQECGLQTQVDLPKLDREKDALEKEISKELYHSEDIYETCKLKDGKSYFKFSLNKGYRAPVVFYVNADNFKTAGKFFPVNENGNELHFECDFGGTGTCTAFYDYDDSPKFTPRVLAHKGDRKADVNPRLVESLDSAVNAIKSRLETERDRLGELRDEYLEKLKTPFVPEDKVQIAADAVTKQYEHIEIRIADCDRLMALCKGESSREKAAK